MKAPTSHHNPPAPGPHVAPFTPREAATLLSALIEWERHNTPATMARANMIAKHALSLASTCGPALDAEEIAGLMDRLRAHLLASDAPAQFPLGLNVIASPAAAPNKEFAATVTGHAKGLIQVTDQDGDTWDCEPHEIESDELTDAPASGAPAPVSTYLDTSLGHTTTIDRELLSAHAIVCDERRDHYGFWVYVAQDVRGQRTMAADLITLGFSETFRAVLAHAYALGCAWVLFDCDAEPIAGIDAPGHQPDAGTKGGV